MGVYTSIEKILRYRIERSIKKGLLSSKTIGGAIKILAAFVFSILLAGIMNVNPNNFPNTTLFLVVNIVYLAAMYMIVTSIEKKSRDRTLIYIGMTLIILLMFFTTWFVMTNLVR